MATKFASAYIVAIFSSKAVAAKKVIRRSKKAVTRYKAYNHIVSTCKFYGYTLWETDGFYLINLEGTLMKRII